MKVLARLARFFRRGDPVDGQRLAPAASASPPGDSGSAKPDVAAWLEAGHARERSGDHDAAEAYYRKALSIDSDNADAEYFLGALCGRRGDHEQAVVSLQRAIALKPDLPEAHYRLGLALLARGQAEDAKDAFRMALHYRPGHGAAHANLGNACRQTGDYDEALACFQELLQGDGRHAITAHRGIAGVLYQQRRLDEALQSYRAIVDMAPGDRDAQNGIVNILRELGRLDEAETFVREALRTDPTDHKLHCGLGLILRQQGRAAAAELSLRAALARNPSNAVAQLNLFGTLCDQGREDEALAYYDTLASGTGVPAELAWARALVLLKLGRFEEGWRAYETRWAAGTSKERGFPYPRWDGESLRGKTVLVYAEQGIGDEIMFASCLPDVIAQAGHCVIDCTPKLAPIFTRSFPAATVHGGSQGGDQRWLGDVPPIDLQVPCGSLPAHFRNALEDFPHHTGYLQADPQRVEHWRQRLDDIGEGTRIGISWRGGTEKSHTGRRSIALDGWAPLLRVEGAHFFNLQYNTCEDEVLALQRNHGVTVHTWQEAIDDYDETAALVVALDLVISVQTALVHLSGALGQAAWALLSSRPEWRYGLAGERMPWYPSVRLFRQGQGEGWEAAIARVAAELEARPKGRNR